MPLKRIGVDRGKGSGYTSPGQRFMPDPPPGMVTIKSKAKIIPPAPWTPPNEPQDRNIPDVTRPRNLVKGQTFVESGYSEPRSGGAVDRAMTGIAHESRHPNVIQIERGNDYIDPGTIEPHNDAKFAGYLEVIVPPAGFERLPVHGEINNPATSHGYQAGTISYAAEAFGQAQNQYPTGFSEKGVERGSGIVGDQIQQWGQPRVIMGPHRHDKEFIDRGDLSVDTGEEGQTATTMFGDQRQ